jgi:hypothetical protein
MADQPETVPKVERERRLALASIISTLLLAVFLSVGASIGMPMEHAGRHVAVDRDVHTANAARACDGDCIVINGRCTTMNGCAYCAAIPRSEARSVQIVTLAFEPRPASLLCGTTVPPDFRPPILAA